MDRCVTKVQKQGHDKQSAIAICYTSIAGRKERRARRMQAMNAAIYKANYGARAGQTIQGALGRDASGHFVRVGAGESGGIGVNRLARQIGAGKRAGRAKKPTISQAEQDSTSQKAGLDSADAHALKAFAKGGPLDDARAARLEKAGLVERATDGSYRMASNARGVLRGIQNGDERVTADALSRAHDRLQHTSDRQAQIQQRQQDRANRQAQRQQEHAARQSQSEQSRQQREGQRASARQQREQQRNTNEAQKVSDQVDQIEAQIGEDKHVTETERVRRVNRLEALSKRLDKAGGDKSTQGRIDAALSKLSTKELSSLAVFKQADGSYRWLAYSSNAFRDRDGEIVSTKALGGDVARTDGGESSGPLRWWHVGSVSYDVPLDWQTSKAGEGIDVGACDFRAVQDRMLIESGTLKSADIGEAVAANPGAFQMSIGFTHPADEPDGDGTYHNIRVFERSLLPSGKAANPFTAIQVQEASMASLKEKWDSFVALFGGDESKAKEFAALTDEKQKEIEAAGIAFKEEEFKAQWTVAFQNNLPDSSFLYVESGGSKDGEGKTVPRTLRHFPYKDSSGKIDLPHLRNAIARIPQSSLSADLKASLQAKAQGLLAQQNKEKEIDMESEEKKEGAPVVEAEVKAAAPAAPAASADQTPADQTQGNQPGGDVTFVGDMTAEEFTALLVDALQQVLAPMTQSMGEVSKAITEAQASAANSAKEITTIKESASVTVAALDKRVAELEGDAPTAKHAGYRATQDAGTITQKQGTPPQKEDDISKLAAFMFGTNGKAE